MRPAAPPNVGRLLARSLGSVLTSIGHLDPGLRVLPARESGRWMADRCQTDVLLQLDERVAGARRDSELPHLDHRPIREKLSTAPLTQEIEMVIRYAGRTVNGIPPKARALAEHPALQIDGLVERSLSLTPEDIHALPHEPYLGGLSETAAGNVPQADWTGVRLRDLVALAGPSPEARYVRVSAGPYGVPVPLERAARVLLCDGLGGEPLGVEHGGPWRLVLPDEIYFTSVKWVDRIEVTADEPDDSATRIAIARERARQSQRRKQGEG